jgi:predicted transcriptional regulator
VDMEIDFEKMHAAVHPSRIKILEFLKKNPKTHVSEIAEKMGMDRSTLAYHLGLLERMSLVKSTYVILKQPNSMGKAGRVYCINDDEVKKVSETVTKNLLELSTIKNNEKC